MVFKTQPKLNLHKILRPWDHLELNCWWFYGQIENIIATLSQLKLKNKANLACIDENIENYKDSSMIS